MTGKTTTGQMATAPPLNQSIKARTPELSARKALYPIHPLYPNGIRMFPITYLEKMEKNSLNHSGSQGVSNPVPVPLKGKEMDVNHSLRRECWYVQVRLRVQVHRNNSHCRHRARPVRKSITVLRGI